ncbi:type II toxin-antitoxin system RelE/ParE family toxin [Dyella koreensis]|uniref:type II toxin-antitoxin system RelE/ParE family toxin n=1 Tax=Dyella koreensis TaxID=311235 RepID=UPI0036165CF4
MKQLAFLGSALDDLKDFPVDARRETGYELHRIQNGLDPHDWKPMTSVGDGVREIRIRDEAGIYRVLYVANIGDVVYVLHAFNKKTQRTAKSISIWPGNGSKRSGSPQLHHPLVQDLSRI